MEGTADPKSDKERLNEALTISDNLMIKIKELEN